MRYLLSTLLIVLLVTPVLQGQGLTDPGDYNWEIKPVPHDLTEEELLESAIIVKDYRERRIVEYQREYLEYYTKHIIVKLNDDNAIEEHNKIFIPISASANLIQLKARSISPDGKALEVNKNNIKEMENLEGYGAYKIFAIEGCEKGGEVEYMYTYVRPAPTYGREVFQSDTRTKNLTFIFSSPRDMTYEFKTYNDLPEMEQNRYDEFRVWKLDSLELAPLRSEKYASLRPNYKRIEFRLQKYRGATDYSEENITSLIRKYKAFLGGLTKKEEKALAKYIKKNPELQGELNAKIIEEHILDGFTITNDGGEELLDMTSILDTRLCSELGLIRLYSAFLDRSGIFHEMVMGCDKTYYPFDKDFLTLAFLDEIFIYIPEERFYLCPGRMEYRSGVLPPEFTGTFGMFIPINAPSRTYTSSNVYDVRYIDQPDAEWSKDILVAEVSFTDDMEASINVEKKINGYNAVSIQPYFKFLSEDEQQEFLSSYLSFGNENGDVTNATATNFEVKDIIANAYFTTTGQITANELIENAGNKYIFRIGEVIGPQVEMYQEQDRVLDIDFPFPKVYERTITVNIPEGYVLKGLEDLNMDIQFGEDDRLTMGFTSSYELKGDQLILTCTEYYEQSEYPKSQFEEFRSVINAAADFNKLIIFLESE